jgi:OmpA-OmpF porin, OOP family
MTKLRYTFLPLALLLAASAYAQSVQIQVELLNQIGTDTSRKGDLISGRVISPPKLQGDVVEGKITESKSGAKLGGKSSFSFTFETIRHFGAAVAISSQFRSVVNSKGKANVDEEGRIVRRAGGNVAKAAGGTGLGALMGGVVGGGKGAAIGAAIGAGASILLIEVAADGPNIKFSPGSRFLIDASARDGSDLNEQISRQAAAVAVPAAPASPPPPAQSPAVAAAPAPAAPTPQTTPLPESSAQPEMTTLKSSFVPGEKTIFYDDFTDMTAGDAPPHFKVRGAAPELRGAGAVRQLTAIATGTLTPNLTALPKNFTYEADIKLDGDKRALINVSFFSKNKEYLQMVTYADPKQMDLVASLRVPFQELGRKRLLLDRSQIMKFALWIQNGRMRVFINGEKQLDFNQVELPAIDKVDILHSLYDGVSVGYRSVRFAESTPDFSQVISSSGRFVTHGILFDTDSDRIKAESAPVIQSIAKGLETNPNLKLQIEGHTDSVGDKAHNMDLSKRRAEAVKAVLVAQFSVDAARLTTAGMGATKPIDSNDTPQGRSQNRRVEFVKQ